MRVLLIEDDSILNETLTDHLEANRFSVEACYDATDGLEMLGLYDFQAVLLDLGLPDMKGETCLRKIRAEKPEMPVIVLTGRDDKQSCLDLLEAGADDYMTKPFSSDELIARMRANIRRANGHSDNIIRSGSFALDLKRQLVQIDGVDLNLTRKEFEMLRLMVLQKGGVISKEAFLDHLYGGMDEPEIKIIDVFICKLRKKLEHAMAGQKIIETVWGRGYRVNLREAA
jgi:two-component system cell cycle response regulator CtrA